MKNLFTLLISLFFTILIYSQNSDSLYIKYNKNISITQNDSMIWVGLPLRGTDVKTTTYMFWIDNISMEFGQLKLKDIKDTLSKEKMATINLTTFDDFSKMDACTLHFLLSDTRPIYLIKPDGDKNYIYKLVYNSSQRGLTLSTH